MAERRRAPLTSSGWWTVKTLALMAIMLGYRRGTTVLDGNSQFDWTPKQAGAHKITFIVDADDHVAETKESNNSQSVTVTVEGSKSTLAFEYPLRAGDHAPCYAGYDVANEGLKFIDEYKAQDNLLWRKWSSHVAADVMRGKTGSASRGPRSTQSPKGRSILVQSRTDGNAIVIEHQLPTQQAWGSDKIYSVYLHVKSSVTSGESVDAETAVGTVRKWPGNTPHLHWEIRTYASMNDSPIPAACKKSGVVGPSYTDTGTNPDDFGYINPSRWVEEN